MNHVYKNNYLEWAPNIVYFLIKIEKSMLTIYIPDLFIAVVER